MKWVVAINSAIPAAIIAIKPNRANAGWLAWLAAIVAVIGGLFIPHYASRMNWRPKELRESVQVSRKERHQSEGHLLDTGRRESGLTMTGRNCCFSRPSSFPGAPAQVVARWGNIPV